MSVTQDYNAALISDDHWRLRQIETEHDLFGYPPQLVSVGLAAVDAGKDPHEAIEEFLHK